MLHEIDRVDLRAIRDVATRGTCIAEADDVTVRDVVRDELIDRLVAQDLATRVGALADIAPNRIRAGNPGRSP